MCTSKNRFQSRRLCWSAKHIVFIHGDTKSNKRTSSTKILSSSIRTPSYPYLVCVTVSIYGSANRMSSLNMDPARITSSSTLIVCLFPFGGTRDFLHFCIHPCPSAVCTAYRLKSHTMIDVGVRSSIVTARCPAIVVIYRIDAGSDSNQRMTGTPQEDHGTVVCAKPRMQRKGAQACWDVRQEGTAVHDEREGTCVVEEARCVCVRVLDAAISQNG